MKCLVILLFIAYLALVVSARQHDLHVKIVDDIEKFKAVHPGVHVEYLDAHSFDNIKEQKNYYIGSRIRGDRLVSSGAKNQNWPVPQDIGVTFSYPSSGTGSILSYISINVTQSSSIGQAYITRGGIGSRFVTLVVEAYGTTYFNYAAAFYGY